MYADAFSSVYLVLGAIQEPEQVKSPVPHPLCPRAEGQELARKIDDKLAALPGLAELHLVPTYRERQGVV